MRAIPHGGDLESVRRRYGLGDRPLVDFSTPSNPLGPSPAAIAAARAALEPLDRYPEPGSPRLTEAIAEHLGVPADRVLVAAGATEVIGLIGQSLREVLALHALQRGDAAMPVSHLIEPTFGEYRRASVLNELRLEAWSGHVLGWTHNVFPESAAGIFWTGHPNNPTGSVWDRDDLLDRVDRSLGLLTVVDESLLPFLADEASRTLVDAVATRENLLVVRSFSAFYALPAVRVGYAVASPDMVVRLRQFQSPWAVSPVAEAAAIAALGDRDHAAETVRLIAAEAPRLAVLLWDLPGLRPAWPDRNRGDGAPAPPSSFLLSLTETAWNSTQVHEALAQRGIVVRECSDFPGLEVGALLTGPDQLVATRGHIRVAVRTRAENDRLVAALAEVLSSEPPR